MAARYFGITDGIDPSLQIRYDDLGDGAHALRVSAGGCDCGNTLIVTPAPEERANEGDAFYVGYSTPIGSEIANNASLDFLILTDDKLMSLTADWFAQGDFQLYFYEGTRYSNPGTAVPSFNRNRDFGNPSDATFYIFPTITDLGLEIPFRWVLNGTGGLARASIASFDNKWILRKNFSYMFRMTNRSGIARRMGLIIDYFEEEEDE